MLERLDEGFARPAPVPRRRRPRAAYAAHRAARPPRAARRRRPRRAGRDPGAAARRGRPDVAARRRPDPAGQEPAARLPRPRRGRPRVADRDRARPRPAASASGTGPWTTSRPGRAVLDEQRITQALLQLADNAVKHTDPGSEIAVGSVTLRRRSYASGCATPATASTRQTGRPSSNVSAAVAYDPATRASAWACRSSTPSSRPTGAPSRSRDAEPRGARVELIIPTGSAKETSWLRS